MILVDTSAWIEFINKGSKSPYGSLIQEWINSEEELCLTEIIITEILQGIDTKSMFNKIEGFLLDFPIYTPKGIESYIGAANIYQNCRRNGLTIRSTIDCLIAQIAMENNLEVFHKDRDFEFISKCCALRCVVLN